MRLHNPGPGEIADRLTILALKILHGTQANRPVVHFLVEQRALLATLPACPVSYLLKLAAINGALWHAEDLLRGAREEGAASPGSRDAVADLAFRIQDLNDQRARVVADINRWAGRAHQEKF